jgi:hypothetical protein
MMTPLMFLFEPIDVAVNYTPRRLRPTTCQVVHGYEKSAKEFSRLVY